jgi:hypothetical protein
METHQILPALRLMLRKFRLEDCLAVTGGDPDKLVTINVVMRNDTGVPLTQLAVTIPPHGKAGWVEPFGDAPAREVERTALVGELETYLRGMIASTQS